MAEEDTNTLLLEDHFFGDSVPPSFLLAYQQAARDFIDAQQKAHRRIALVTSGGTTVPLENQTVRFIDNFSAGTRGATSAEYFLAEGYAVIFFHRKFSLLPYSRHYSHTSNCFLDFMVENKNGQVAVRNEYQDNVRDVLRQWTKVKTENRLLMLSFVTVSDYLWLLRELSTLLQPMGSSSVLYLAAAVSDFFIPKGRLSEHKIQSTGTEVSENDNGQQVSSGHSQKLMVDLDPVPKFLKRLVDGWAPTAMVVSFKLETDSNILLSKAQASLERYAHQLVIGNLLSTRTWEVVFVEPHAKERWIRIPTHKLVQDLLGRSADTQNATEKSAETPPEIESIIVPEVVKLHSKHIASFTTT